MPAIADRRRRLLRALGVTPYQLRGAPLAPADVAGVGTPVVEASAEADAVALVLVLPRAGEARALDLLGRALHGFGASFARAPRVDVIGGELRHRPPPATAYLVFGPAQAHALGRALSAAAMQSAQVQMLDQPDALLTADGKRRLWQALCNLRRGLRQSVAQE